MEKIIDLGQMITLLNYNTAALKEIFALNKICNITANEDILNDIINKAEAMDSWDSLFHFHHNESKKVRVWQEAEYININYNNIARIVVYRYSEIIYKDNKEPKRVVFYKLLKPNILEQ